MKQNPISKMTTQMWQMVFVPSMFTWPQPKVAQSVTRRDISYIAWKIWKSWKFKTGYDEFILTRFFHFFIEEQEFVEKNTSELFWNILFLYVEYKLHMFVFAIDIFHLLSFALVAASVFDISVQIWQQILKFNGRLMFYCFQLSTKRFC